MSTKTLDLRNSVMAFTHILEIVTDLRQIENCHQSEEEICRPQRRINLQFLLNCCDEEGSHRSFTIKNTSHAKMAHLMLLLLKIVLEKINPMLELLITVLGISCRDNISIP